MVFGLFYYGCSIGTRTHTFLQLELCAIVHFLLFLLFVFQTHFINSGIPHERRLNGCFEIDFCFVFNFLLWGCLKRNKTLRD